MLLKCLRRMSCRGCLWHPRMLIQEAERAEVGVDGPLIGPLVCIIGHLDKERDRAREAAETQECIGAHVVQNGYPARPSVCVFVHFKLPC